jgi:septal ring factor EnvC (AmiA/AmiB activator)
VSLLRLAFAPLVAAQQAAADLATLAAFARRFETLAPQLLERADQILAVGRDLHELGAVADANVRDLIGVGERNVRVGADMADLARMNIEGNRDTNEAMRALDVRMAELLRFAAMLEQELPALTQAAPPMQAAAERVERIASRIPGVRG